MDSVRAQIEEKNKTRAQKEKLRQERSRKQRQQQQQAKAEQPDKTDKVTALFQNGGFVSTRTVISETLPAVCPCPKQIVDPKPKITHSSMETRTTFQAEENKEVLEWQKRVEELHQ